MVALTSACDFLATNCDDMDAVPGIACLCVPKLFSSICQKNKVLKRFSSLCAKLAPAGFNNREIFKIL